MILQWWGLWTNEPFIFVKNYLLNKEGSFFNPSKLVLLVSWVKIVLQPAKFYIFLMLFAIPGVLNLLILAYPQIKNHAKIECLWVPAVTARVPPRVRIRQVENHWAIPSSLEIKFTSKQLHKQWRSVTDFETNRQYVLSAR